jgi:hypothetical protein
MCDYGCGVEHLPDWNLKKRIERRQLGRDSAGNIASESQKEN